MEKDTIQIWIAVAGILVTWFFTWHALSLLTSFFFLPVFTIPIMMVLLSWIGLLRTKSVVQKRFWIVFGLWVLVPAFVLFLFGLVLFGYTAHEFTSHASDEADGVEGLVVFWGALLLHIPLYILAAFVSGALAVVFLPRLFPSLAVIPSE